MAPFPEDEIMTIKRLEVALRKSDFKLLKDGAYKLHEKYHSHYHFEYTDLLKDILREVEANYAIPPDIKDILIPTINDILSNNQNYEQNRVSSLTSLSYGVNSSAQYNTDTKAENIQEQKPINDFAPQKEHEYIKPFQEFEPIKPIDLTQPKQEALQEEKETDEYSSFDKLDIKPAEDFITGVPIVQQNIFDSVQEEEDEEPKEYLSFESSEQKEDNQEELVMENNEINLEQDEKEEEAPYFNQNFDIQETSQPSIGITEEQEEVVEQTEEEQETQEIQEEDKKTEISFEEIKQEEIQKSIAIFFGQDFSNEKINNINKYREFLQSDSAISLKEFARLFNEIKIQADTNVSELRVLLLKLNSTLHNINLITNSQSANLVDLFMQNDISYSIFNPTEEKRVNLLPLLGLTNMHKCFECGYEYVDANEQLNSFIYQCPKCKSAMLPDLYTMKSEINMDYYNSSIIALANSDVWVLIHPLLSEKFTLNLIRSALKISSHVKEIYIMDKDINVRETYRKLFEDINSDVKININPNAMEEFFSNI